MPGDLAIGSKWGYRYCGGWRMDAEVQEVKDHSAGMLRRQWSETERILGPYVGLYQIHSATLQSGVLEDEAVLRGLDELTRKGVAVGLSVSGPAQADVVRRALEVEVDGRTPFSAVQATFNILEPSVGPALAEAHDRGWGVLVKEALANGRLAGRATAPGLLGARAARHGAQIGQMALAGVLAQPWADVVLTGAVTERQLAANVDALSLPLDDEDRAATGTLAEDPEDYWSRRAALPWH